MTKETAPGTRLEALGSVRIPPSFKDLNVFIRSLLFGLVAGWLNLAMVQVQKALDPSISMAALRTNRHALWMIPCSSVVLFALLGLAMLLLARFRASLVERASWPVLTGLLVLTPALDVEGLYPVAALVLAMGAGLRFGPRISRLALAYHGLRLPVLTMLGLGLIVTVGVDATRVLTQESRAVASLPSPSPDAPNVLLLVLDNVRAESMSLYGHDRPTTPNLDRLARRGTVFNEARSTSSWTLPSHASLMTGRWCNELNFGFNRALDAAHPTLAEFLSRAGYVTAGFVGNTYYANAIYGLSRGFSRYEDHYENLQISLFEVIRSGGLGKRVLHFLGYPIHVEEGASIRKTAAMLNRDLLSWIDNRPEDRPFFGFVNYFDAHAPFLPPRGFETRFGMAALPTSEKARILKRSVRLGTNPATPGENADEIRLQAQAIARDSYESCLAYLDQEIGRLMDALDRRGLSEKTLIVITSDHGEHFGERGFSGHGRSLYRPEVHVPLLVLWPRDRADRMAQVVDQPVTNREVPTTVADLLDLGATSPFSGSSLARFRRAAPAPEQTPVLSELDHQRDLQPMREVPASLGPVKALIRDGKVYMQVGTDHEELYDLETDPREMRNLLSTVDRDRSGNPTHVLARSHRTLLGRLTGERPPTEIAEDSQARLRR